MSPNNVEKSYQIMQDIDNTGLRIIKTVDKLPYTMILRNHEAPT